MDCLILLPCREMRQLEVTGPGEIARVGAAPARVAARSRDGAIGRGGAMRAAAIAVRRGAAAGRIHAVFRFVVWLNRFLSRFS